MSLARNGAVIFGATMVGNVSNYLFQFFMGKYLGVEDYGSLNAVLSLFVIVAIPSTTVMLVVARYSARFSSSGEVEKVGLLYRSGLRKTALMAALIAVPFVVFRSHISAYLNLPDSVPVIIIAAAVVLALLLTVNLGLLQGLHRFYLFSASMGLGGVLKLLFGAGLVLAGFSLDGATASVALSSLAVLCLSTLPLAGYLRSGASGKKTERHTREILAYCGPVLASTVAITVFTNVDIIFVKHLFSGVEAGLYSSVAILGRAVFYLPSAFVLALFPMVSAKSTGPDHRAAFRLLDRALVYTIALALSAVGAFVLFPEFILRVCFGGRYLAAAPLLKYYGAAMMLMAVTNILVGFNLARNRKSFIYLLAAGCALLVALLNILHSSLAAVVVSILAINAAVALGLLFLTFHEKRAIFRSMR